MAELRTEVKTYKVEYACDNCDEGRMYETGEVITTGDAPQRVHSCTACGNEQVLGHMAYPYIVHEPLVSGG